MQVTIIIAKNGVYSKPIDGVLASENPFTLEFDFFTIKETFLRLEDARLVGVSKDFMEFRGYVKGKLQRWFVSKLEGISNALPDLTEEN